MTDAAGADASREATARSAPHTARDDIVCDTAETRGRENRGRNQILEPGSCRDFFLETAESALPPRDRVRAIPSRARAGRVSRRTLARAVA